MLTVFILGLLQIAPRAFCHILINGSQSVSQLLRTGWLQTPQTVDSQFANSSSCDVNTVQFSSHGVNEALLLLMRFHSSDSKKKALPLTQNWALCL